MAELSALPPTMATLLMTTNSPLPPLHNKMESTSRMSPALLQPKPTDAVYPPSKTSQRHLTTTLATPFMPTRTRMEWLLSNLRETHLALWAPDTVYRRHTQSRLHKPDAAPAHPIIPIANMLCLRVAHLQYHTNNSLANHETSHYNPAFDLHPMWPSQSQTCLQQHLILVINNTRTYNLAFDIHPMPANNHPKCHQYHMRLPSAAHVPVFARTNGLPKCIPTLQQPTLHPCNGFDTQESSPLSPPFTELFPRSITQNHFI